MGSVRLPTALAAFGTAVGLTFMPSEAPAQGCEPIRFTVPISLDAEGEAYERGHEWKITIAYRWLNSNQWFMGTEERGNLAPGGTSPVFKIHTAIVDVSYSFSERIRARVSIPYQTGSFTRKWADSAFHEQSASGIGDISVQGEAWLLTPRTHPRGNIQLGLGIKAPTGSYKEPSQFYLASGPVPFPADQTIQPGDGGWAFMMQLLGFRQLTDRLSAYGFASYMVSPKEQSDVKGAPAPAPNSSVYWSVPDVYSARTGLAFNLFPDAGIAVSLGARIDGIPERDLIGGGDETTIKRRAYVIYADPGVSYTHGKDSYTLSVPWRIGVNRLKSILEQQPGAPPSGGGFAEYLVFLSYSRRI